MEQKAQQSGLNRLFVLTTHTTHWFREHGFDPASVEDLPRTRQSAYNPGRNSRVLLKVLGQVSNLPG